LLKQAATLSSSHSSGYYEMFFIYRTLKGSCLSIRVDKVQ
jgi:hypothetical protein